MLAVALGVHASTVRRWGRQGRLDSYRLPGTRTTLYATPAGGLQHRARTHEPLRQAAANCHPAVMRRLGEPARAVLLALPGTPTDLAARVGMARGTVHRALEQLQRQHLAAVTAGNCAVETVLANQYVLGSCSASIRAYGGTATLTPI